MPTVAPRLNLESATVEALERAATDQAVSVADWVGSVITAELRAKGYLPDVEPDGLRPDELNATNDG